MTNSRWLPFAKFAKINFNFFLIVKQGEKKHGLLVADLRWPFDWTIEQNIKCAKITTFKIKVTPAEL